VQEFACRCLYTLEYLEIVEALGLRRPRTRWRVSASLSRGTQRKQQLEGAGDVSVDCNPGEGQKYPGGVDYPSSKVVASAITTR
jgi:hypothetical protein